MDTLTKQKIDTIKDMVRSLNIEMVALKELPDAKHIKIELDVLQLNSIGRLYAEPFLQVKFLEVTIL